MLSFILFLTMKESLIWMCIVPVYTKVFANCLLSTLNSRPVTTDGEGDRMSPKAGEKEIGSLTSANPPRFAAVSIGPAFATPSTLSGYDASSYTQA
ncbi:hypothetical protein AB1N83_011858 [Pleurotus pulmonarius]